MDSLPKHIGIIMDGNRRWAKERGLPSFEGHRAGYERLKEVGQWCLDSGVKFLTVFGFSTENWKRAPEEVDFLMKLFHQAVTDELDFFIKKNIRLRILGRKENLPESLKTAFANAEEKTKLNSGGTLALAINYGGRAEIIDAAKAIAQNGQEFSEDTFARQLYGSDLPDIDLVIRTSGEQRTSGFMTWQSVYSEIYFEEKNWPDFGREDLQRVLSWYADRERRFGK